jgi:hypothetical protein
VRGGDLSRETETCRRGCYPSEDWVPCRCSVLTKICMPSLRRNTQVESALLLDVVIIKGAAILSCLPADRSLHLVDDGFVLFK